MSRAAETLANTPLSTLSIVALCSLVYLFQTMFDCPIHYFTMCPRLVIHLNEYYRFITSSLFHSSLMHIGMNMMSTIAIGSALEKKIGTFMMASTILWGILLTSVVYTVTSWMLYIVFGYGRLMYQHSVGFSGVIFQLCVLEVNLGPNVSRSVFGFFRVSPSMYPWALLLILQLIMPQISFLGHLSGIIVGTLQLYGVLDSIFFPSYSYLKEMEQWTTLRPVTSSPGYAYVPEESTEFRRDPSGLLLAFFAAVGVVFSLMKNIGETIYVILFGRGEQENENIQLGSFGTAWGSSETNGAGIIQDIENDEEWAGLPSIDEVRRNSRWANIP